MLGVEYEQMIGIVQLTLGSSYIVRISKMPYSDRAVKKRFIDQYMKNCELRSKFYL